MLASSGRPVEIPLYSTTVALRAPGERVLVAPESWDTIVPGTRVLAGQPATAALVEQEAAWMASARVPVVPGLEALTRSALLDLRVLTEGLPAAVAGWSPQWRYAWPRDNAFIAVALAEIGDLEGALRELRFFQEVQRTGAWLPARLDPWTRAVPDGRPAQLDGTAWMLWAGRMLLEAGATPQALAELLPLWSRSADVLLASLGADGLPPVSPDYWEVDEDGLTLGVAASVLAGLDSAALVLDRLGDSTRGQRCHEAAERLARLIPPVFGPGYPRHPRADDPCASVAFLAPPIARSGRQLPGVTDALAVAELGMRRPGGGLAPGAGWRDDGISWTPETALVALGWAGLGQKERARALLEWLQGHRTDAGSIPEKVLGDGRPAAVAPLAWTAAVVLLALRRL